jgi:hypothetical protein
LAIAPAGPSRRAFWCIAKAIVKSRAFTAIRTMLRGRIYDKPLTIGLFLAGPTQFCGFLPVNELI